MEHLTSFHFLLRSTLLLRSTAMQYSAAIMDMAVKYLLDWILTGLMDY